MIDNMLTLTPVDCSEPVATHTVLDSHLDCLWRSHVHDGSPGFGKLRHNSLSTGCTVSDFCIRAIRRGLARTRFHFHMESIEACILSCWPSSVNEYCT
jgi:hypothetical protein